MMALPKWLRSRRASPRPGVHPWDVSVPLLQLSPTDYWGIGDSVEGLCALGRSGGGKSRGTALAVFSAMLDHGYGAIFLTAKQDEVANIERLCRSRGRADDLIIIRPGGPWRFNPVDHELRRRGDGAGQADNVVGMLTEVLDLVDRCGSAAGSSASSRDGEAFWRQATMRKLRMFVHLLVLALGTVRIDDLHQAVLSAPQSLEEVRSERWRQSYCYRLLEQANAKPMSPTQRRSFGLICDYILKEHPAMPAKTRGSVDMMFTSMTDVLQHGVIHELFGQDSTFTPEATEEGRILVVGTPVKEWGLLGVVANGLMKFAWQKAIERRAAGPETRPVLLAADECQYFVSPFDTRFQATCRSAKAATVYLTQNLSGLYAALGGGSGDRGKAEADSLLALLNTKVFHCNGDSITNEWAAAQVGRTRKLFLNTGSSRSGDDWFPTVTGLGRNEQRSTGMSEQMSFELEPSVFTTLRTGAPQCGGLIDAVVHQSGRRFAATGKTWLPVVFQPPRSS
ncbi:MAG: hypothetical protein KF745_02860 [Phycisphaeraceae bacterium]|nr:hypothetical protein [Phycisphaeraceae bacterium]